MGTLSTTLSKLLSKFRRPVAAAEPALSKPAEVAHWNEIDRRTRLGERIFWLNHPRIFNHYTRKSLVDGLTWYEWVARQLGGPAETALELGCGSGAVLDKFLRGGIIKTGVGIDLDASRFTNDDRRLSFRAGDVNHVKLEPNRYDLIYAVQSFHHFEELDAIMEQVRNALTDRGFFVMNEFVGPRRFQWTDGQLAVIAQLLGLMPKHLRMYASGVEKREEGRSTPEEVMRVSESEAVRSDEIVPAFYRHFNVVHHRKLGGTIQHLLYSGIVHNFPDDDPEIDHMIDCIDGIETTLIDGGVLESDFAILIGTKHKPAGA